MGAEHTRFVRVWTKPWVGPLTALLFYTSFITAVPDPFRAAMYVLSLGLLIPQGIAWWKRLWGPDPEQPPS